ncbi:MAG: Plug domain-containing protein, partial [Gemmatimonadota bacterium]
MGFLPETLLVVGSLGEVSVLLSRRPVTLSELTVSVQRNDDLAPAAVGSWTVPRAVLAAVPPALESDPLRALVAVPGVTFSSPLSARPVVRGYDAAESLVRLDGFELVNPYHIGRVFAAFPLDFTRNVDVAVTPHRATDAGTLAGVVDLVGVQSGVPQQLNGGTDFSIASGTAWYGWRGPVQGFAGARVASLKFVTGLFTEAVPYDFRDGYARLRVPWPGGHWTDLTFYASEDVLGKRDATPGMGWTNLLLGQRTRLVDRTRWALDLTASLNRFSLDGREIEARRSNIDVRNQLDRSHVGAEVRGWLGAMEWHAALGLGRRLAASEIGVVRGVDFAPRATRSRLTEFSGFASARI